MLAKGLREEAYLRERIKEVLTGASATIVVRIEGPDLDRLQAHAAAVRNALAPIDGVVDLKAQPQVLVPQIEVRFRPDRAERLGVTAGDVRRVVTTVVHGSKAGEFFEDQRFFDVVVWGTPEARGSIEAVRAIRLPVPGGSTVPLGAVADVAVAPVQNEITRENGARRIDVTCNVSGRDLGSVARDIDARLATLDLGAGYHAEVLGEYAARAESSRSLLMWGGVALVSILLILLTDFGTVRLTALVFLTLPFEAEYFITPRFTFRVSGDYMLIRPDITVTTPAGTMSDRWNASNLHANVGLGFYPFRK